MQQGTSQADAITINAGPSDAVFIRGLTVDGLGSGRYGLNFNTGAKLAITNCIFRHFVNIGVFINSSSPMAYSVSNTVVSDNGAGIYILGSAPITGTISHTEADNNDQGVEQAINDSAAVTIVDSVAANNTYDGFYIQKGQATLSRVTANGSNFGITVETDKTVLVSDSTASNNVDDGLFNDGGIVIITRFTATGNGAGLSTEFGTVFTYGDNRILENGTNVSGTLTPVTGN